MKMMAMLGQTSETTGTNKEEDDVKERNTKKMKEVEILSSEIGATRRENVRVGARLGDDEEILLKKAK